VSVMAGALIAIINCFDLARRADFYDGTRARSPRRAITVIYETPYIININRARARARESVIN